MEPNANAAAMEKILHQTLIQQEPQIGPKPNANGNAINLQNPSQMINLNGTKQLAATHARKVKQLVELDYLTRAHALVELQPKSSLLLALGASPLHLLQDCRLAAILLLPLQYIHW
jgi:hypothetical protein